MISAPINHPGLLYKGAYYAPFVGASVSAIPSNNPGAVSTIKPAYDVSMAKEAMQSTINSPISQQAPLQAKAAFLARAAVTGTSLGPESGNSAGVRATPYNVTQANRAYQQVIQGN